MFCKQSTWARRINATTALRSLTLSRHTYKAGIIVPCTYGFILSAYYGSQCSGLFSGKSVLLLIGGNTPCPNNADERVRAGICLATGTIETVDQLQ